MKNFGTIIDNFDAVTKQYVDNKVPTDDHIKGIKVDNATLADTAKKVQNAFTYKAHDKTDGTAVSISYDGSEAASLDFVADDFAPVYTSGNDLGLKLVDKGYATKTYVDNQDALKLDKAGGSITGNLTVGGNLTINGTTTTVDSTTLQVKDKLIEVAHGNTTTLTTPAGLVAPKYDGTNSGALVFDSTGTAYVGDVTLKDGNIDVANSDLQPLATRTGLVGGNLVQYDSSAQTLKDSGKKISDLALKTDIPTDYVTTDTDQDIKGKKTVIPPDNKDNSNQIATTAWAGRRYKSIADFGFTSQTTVKAIVQKIIDNWYEYCTFACTNDNFNNFSDTPDGYGTLIIDVGSNALRPLISFTKQVGDSNSYKYWQANIVRGANNQVTEIQWYEIINSNLPQTISGAKTFVSNIYISQTSGQNAGITWQSASDNTNRGIFRHYDDGTTETFVTQSGGFLFRPLNNNNTKSIKVDPAAGALYPEQNSGADLGKTGQCWNNGYITNLQLCKVINGGGGNSLIQQNSDTAGADITVGSTNCALKMLGKNARPTYRQGKNGTYANLALQSDIPIPFDSNDLSTGTYRSTKLPSGCSLVYIEDRAKRFSGYFYKGSEQSGFQELYFITSYYTTASGKTTLVIYELRINGAQVEKTYKNLFVSSNGSVEVSGEYVENGTFYYKVLK